MDAKDLQKWQQEKAKELFDYSHKLLDAAKQLSEHHIAEMEWGMKNALDSAKSAAKNDLAKLKDLQEEAAKEAAKRATVYQKKSLFSKILARARPMKLKSILKKFEAVW
jgi:nitrogen fixation/metabolism regulation signal transduction histidine kinase